MAKKAAPKAPEPKAPAPVEKKVAKPKTKAEVFSKLAESTGLTKKQIATVFEHLSELIKTDLGKKGPGQFVVPGLLKLRVQVKKATPAGQRLNPFTKQMMNVPAKPARKVVKALPLKSLKEMV